jgi:saxitoxin biosynthesis operon SxtJ-like protein
MTKPASIVQRDRQFGLSVGTVVILLAVYLWWDGRVVNAQVLGAVGAVLILLGYLQPRLLRYPSAAWWTLAAVLGYINARVILILIFSLLLVPLGLLWRVIGRDPLARRRKSFSGWTPHPARYRDRAHYQRMY